MKRPFGVVTDTGRFVRGDVLEQYAVKGASLQLPTQQTFEGDRGLLSPKYDPTHLAGLLETNTAHLVACRQKAEDVIGRGWDVVATVDDADPAVRERLKAWLEAIPPPTSALDSHSNRDVFTAAAFDFEAVGRGALELVRGDDPSGQVEMIVHVPAHTLRLHRDGVRFVQSRGGKRRWFKWAGGDFDLDYESGETRALGELRPERRATEIVWWRNYHPSDPVYGMPDVIPAIGAIHGDLGRRDYNLEFFANFGIPAYAVFVTGDFDPGKWVDETGTEVADDDPAGMYELEWHIQTLLKKVQENPHSSLVFTIPTRDGADDGQVKMEFKPLATDVKEASFRLYRRDNREEVLSANRMSSAIAGVFDAGQANREARAQYKQAVIWPRRTMLEMVVNHFIVASFGSGWRWTLAPLDSKDADSLLAHADSGLKSGAITPREYRRIVAPLLGISPDVPANIDDPALDRFYLNGTQLGAAAEDGAAGELRGLRDDLVAMAAKATNGRAPHALADLVTLDGR